MEDKNALNESIIQNANIRLKMHDVKKAERNEDCETTNDNDVSKYCVRALYLCRSIEAMFDYEEHVGFKLMDQSEEDDEMKSCFHKFVDDLFKESLKGC